MAHRSRTIIGAQQAALRIFAVKTVRRPLVLVPVFGVPLAVLLHVASLVKLGRDAVRRPVLNGEPVRNQ